MRGLPRTRVSLPATYPRKRGPRAWHTGVRQTAQRLGDRGRTSSRATQRHQPLARRTSLRPPVGTSARLIVLVGYTSKWQALTSGSAQMCARLCVLSYNSHHWCAAVRGLRSVRRRAAAIGPSGGIVDVDCAVDALVAAVLARAPRVSLVLPWVAAVDGPRGEPEAVPAACPAAPPGPVRPPARRRVLRARRGGVASHRGARGGRKERRIASATFMCPLYQNTQRAEQCH